MTQLKFTSNNVLRAAVAAAFGVASMGAQAVVNLNAGTGTVKAANEIPSTTKILANGGGSLNIALTGPAGTAPTGTDPMYIKINMASSVYFITGDPTMTCSGATGTDSGSANNFLGVKQAGGVGFNYVTFTFTAGTAGGTGSLGSFATGACTLTVNAAGLSGFTIGTNVNVTARTEYKDGASYTTAFLSDKPYVTFIKGVSAAVSAASAVIVDATSGSDNFSTDSDLAVSAAADFGRYYVQGTGMSAAQLATLAGAISATDVYTAVGVTVTVSGAALAAGLAANSSAGVFLVTGAAPTCSAGDTTGVFSSTANAGTTVTFTGLSNATIGGSGVILCMNISGGSAQIATGAVYIGANEGNVANVTTNLGGMRLLTTVSTNGVTKNAYIVHSPSSSTKTTQLWMKNTGATAGPVYVTCYNMAGTVVGTSNSSLVSSIAVNELVKKTSSDIFTAIGYSSYAATDKFSCVVNGALAGLEMVNQTQDTTNGSIVTTQSQTN